MFSNKYTGTCNNPTCKSNVPAGLGFTQKINGRYVVWCMNCVPQESNARRDIVARRALTIDGHRGFYLQRY